MLTNNFYAGYNAGQASPVYIGDQFDRQTLSTIRSPSTGCLKRKNMSWGVLRTGSYQLGLCRATADALRLRNALFVHGRIATPPMWARITIATLRMPDKVIAQPRVDSGRANLRSR